MPPSWSARSHRAVLINDLESVASWAGRCHWFDDRLWDMAKYFCAPDSTPLVARNLTGIVMATRGRLIKCVVVIRCGAALSATMAWTASS